MLCYVMLCYMIYYISYVDSRRIKMPAGSGAPSVFVFGGFYFACVMQFHGEFLFLLNSTILGVTFVSPPKTSHTQNCTSVCEQTRL